MFKLINIAPMLWMAWKWYQGQKSRASGQQSRYDTRRRR